VKTETDSEARHYLAAVERAASGLPAEQRRELIADLSEHIQVALAERPGAITEILAELGDPLAIAATALHEDDTAVPSRRSNPLTPMLLLMLGEALAYAPGPDALALPFLVLVIAGLVTLRRSNWWTTPQKWAATVVGLFLPTLMIIEWNTYGKGHGLTALRVLLDITVTVLHFGALAWLWHNRNALAQPDAAPLSRNTQSLLLALALLALVVLAVGWVGFA
jgi:uncharacterized membrane protein